MGPDELMLEFADYILDNHPNIHVDRYTLAYAIQDWVDRELDAMMNRERSCHDIASNLITVHSLIDSQQGLAETIQDFIDIIEVRLNEQSATPDAEDSPAGHPADEESTQEDSASPVDRSNPQGLVEPDGIHQQVDSPHPPQEAGSLANRKFFKGEQP